MYDDLVMLLGPRALLRLAVWPAVLVLLLVGTVAVAVRCG
jgi:hypothetical protein